LTGKEILTGEAWPSALRLGMGLV